MCLCSPVCVSTRGSLSAVRNLNRSCEGRGGGWARSDDEVVGFWNALDSELEFPLDVLDDVCSESKEVYQCGNR